MITLIIGETGSGKTALATYFLIEKYRTERNTILRRSCALIKQLNEEYGRNLSYPDRVPFYTNYKVKLHVSYNEDYEPYFINGYYFGIANPVMDTEFVAPGSVIVLDESQRIFDSRRSASFPYWSSYAFEIHRQAELKIYLLAQRGMLFDRNIKDLGVRVIEVNGVENEKDAAGNVFRSTWHCREFENWKTAEAYLKNDPKTPPEEKQYKETAYTYEGNIFKSFNSHEKIKEFIPPVGFDFDYPSHTKPANASERLAKFYQTGEPIEFRNGKPPESPPDKNKPKPANHKRSTA